MMKPKINVFINYLLAANYANRINIKLRKNIQHMY